MLKNQNLVTQVEGIIKVYFLFYLLWLNSKGMAFSEKPRDKEEYCLQYSLSY